MAQYFTGKNYGISNLTDITGRPFLTYKGPDDKVAVTLYDRVAQTFDFTVPQQLKAGAMKNDRLDSSTAAAIKSILGGNSDDELDHKISLELGGSNSPANLWIQHGVTSGASAASDTLENNLALDVVNGKISLERAWEILGEQKGFALSEKLVIPTTLNKQVFLDVVKQAANTILTGPGSFLNPISILGFPLINLFGQQKKAAEVAPVNKELKSNLDADIAALKQTPLNQRLLTKVFQEQVALTSQQLLISDAEAGKVVGSYLAGYAQNKGIDAKGMMGALNADIQKIIKTSQGDPNIFGVSSVTITKVVAALQLGSTLLVGGGIALAVIGIFIAGPAAIVGALSGGLLESIGAIFGVSALTGIGLTAFAVGEAFNVAAIGLNMSVKSTYDNGYLLPTQQISALKDALSIQKGLAGFLPSEQSSTPSAPTTSSVSGGRKVIGSSTGLFIGHIDQGHLQAVQPFKPQEFQNISTPDDLAAAAQHNLAAYLSSLAGVLDYSIITKAHVTLPDGTELLGNTVYVPTSVSKKGVTHYKKIQDKFAVAEVYIKTSAKGRIHIEDIVLGPIDETKYQPTNSELVDLANKLDKQLITTNTQDIKAITLTPQSTDTSAPVPPATNTLPATTTPPVSGAYLSNTLFQYATRDERGQITDLDPLKFPTEFQSAGTQYRDGHTRFTSDAYNQMKNILTGTVGLDENLALGVLTILDRGENTQEWQFRGDARWAPYGNSDDLATNFGGFHGLAVYLINGGKTTTRTSTVTSVNGQVSSQKTILVPDTTKTPAPTIKPYVIFQGSPDVFDRKTGKYITTADAMKLNIFAGALIEHLDHTRPEVQTATDFAGFAGKDLANFPI